MPEQATEYTSYSPDGNNNTILDIAPPSGKEWHIKNIRMYGDGDDNSGINNIVFAYGVWPDDITPPASNVDSAPNKGVQDSMDSDFLNFRRDQFDAYISSDEHFLVMDQSGVSSSATWHIVVTIHQVTTA